MNINWNVQSVKRTYAVGTAEAVRQEKEENKASSVEIKDRLEISEEGRKSLEDKAETILETDEPEEATVEELAAAESEEPENTEEAKSADANDSESEKRSGKVGFNEGKRARQLAAASTPEQVQMVLDLLNQDLDDCEAGLKQGMCDENEVAKVKAMLQRAHQRMTEVSGQKKEEESQGIDAFAIASLM